MANLGQIQQMLSTNLGYRQRFLQDPIVALAEQGLVLPPEMHHRIRQMVAKAQTPQQAVPGAAAGQLGNSVLQTVPFAPMQTTPLRQIALIIAFE
jgi:hypothetical protein